MKLSPVMERFVLHWGVMGSRWGVNRTVAQIHALLFLSEVPLTAETIADALHVARSNVSTSIRELQGWGLVKAVHMKGDRRDHFQAHRDVREIFRVVVEERKKREIDPTLTVLRDCATEARQRNAEAGTRTHSRHARVHGNARGHLRRAEATAGCRRRCLAQDGFKARKLLG